MKKLFIFILLLITTSATAQVSQQDAAEIAVKWFNNIMEIKASNRQITKLQTFMDEGNICFYIFSFEKGGFVIVATDETMLPVIGYSATSVFEIPDENKDGRVNLDCVKILPLKNMFNGMYIYRLQSGDHILSKKMIILK